MHSKWPSRPRCNDVALNSGRWIRSLFGAKNCRSSTPDTVANAPVDASLHTEKPYVRFLEFPLVRVYVNVRTLPMMCATIAPYRFQERT